ncbi:splicing factor ESS-2 homolog [Palaemon carinicauda]|uniref:splicing factor ESS-2 homolog n=1 Tax=Palaemon carinicauda TaxID=392227 RepID=UPI0035B6531A
MSQLDSRPSSAGALVVSETDNSVFKKPDVPPPRKRKKVLDEDTFVKEVERIIERDFFPDLENLKERVEYLEAKEANDILKLREFYAKYSNGDSSSFRNVEDSPATFETPLSNTGDATPLIGGREGSPKSARDAKENAESKDDDNVDVAKMSLDEFLNSHTSEDNESFEHLMKKNEAKFRLKHAWMFEAEEQHNKDHTPNLSLPTVEQREEASRLAITGTSLQNDSRPKQVENWKFNTFNSVMFVPDGVPMSRAKCIEAAERKKREVNLSNTRYEGNPFTETLSQAAMLEASAVQASKKEGKVGVDGKELGKDTPKFNGYSFVSAPSPVPGVDASPFMTWGEVDGTPIQLDGNQTPLLKRHTPGPSYRIPKVPNRDRLGHMLAEQVSLRHRNKKSKAVSAAQSSLASPLSKLGHHSSSERVTSMSPAAQRLLSSKLGIRYGTDKALRQSYTPSPLTRRGSSTPGAVTPNYALTPDAVSLSSVTPKRREAKKQSKGLPVAGDKEAPVSLTDNLLDLPKRPGVPSRGEQAEEARKCAADFF